MLESWDRISRTMHITELIMFYLASMEFVSSTLKPRANTTIAIQFHRCHCHFIQFIDIIGAHEKSSRFHCIRYIAALSGCITWQSISRGLQGCSGVAEESSLSMTLRLGWPTKQPCCFHGSADQWIARRTSETLL